MANTRQSAPTSRRQLPPPEPVAQDDPTIYDSLIEAAGEEFNPQGAEEPDQTFFARLLRAIEALPDAVWNALEHDVQMWYQNNVDAFQAGQQLKAPDGFVSETPEPDPEPDPEPPPAPAVKRTGAQALKEFNEKRKAARLAAEAANAAPAAAPEPAAPPARARKTVAAETPAVNRRAPRPEPETPHVAKAPRTASAARGPSTTTLMRKYVMDNIDTVTAKSLYEYVTEELGVDAKLSAIAGTLSFTKSTIQLIKDSGHWKD